MTGGSRIRLAAFFLPLLPAEFAIWRPPNPADHESASQLAYSPSAASRIRNPAPPGLRPPPSALHPMRSLALKLTLSFLVVGLIGAALVAVFVGLRTQREFDKFVLDNYQVRVIENLSNYYERSGSWQGLESIVVRNPYSHRGSAQEFTKAPLVLIDLEGTVIFGGQRYQAGQSMPRQEIAQTVPVEVNGEVIGRVLFTNFGGYPQVAESPELQFLGQVRRAIWFGALGATAAALLLGIFLARTIARPVHELTEATQVVARGELGHQVEVRTQDELGKLAESFNQMSADLAQASQLRRQMTADIAHDLRTPLTVILGYTEGLADGKFQGDPEIYDSMHEEAQHLRHLIEDLRTLSLADAGQISLQRQPCPPRDLLERAATAHKLLADEQGVTVRVQADPELPAVSVDPDRMAQVLGNLVGNAVRHTPTGGEITLAAERATKGVILKIRDTGAGIPVDDLPHIFDRHYRGDRARRQDAGASGLGLAIVKSLVELHEGAITVDSAPGKGTTFTISLPAGPTISNL